MNKVELYEYQLLFAISIILIFAFLLIAVNVKFIDEFPADGFACITQPCIMPKITIIEWITQQF